MLNALEAVLDRPFLVTVSETEYEPGGRSAPLNQRVSYAWAAVKHPAGAGVAW
jgi:hypothetical protein